MHALKIDFHFQTHVLFSADYSQIELRILAALTRDEGLLTAFSEGRDIHAATAAKIFDVALDAVTPKAPASGGGRAPSNLGRRFVTY